MSNLPPTPLLTKGKIIQAVLALVVLGFYFISLFFYHDAMPVAISLMLLFAASTNLYQGIGRLRRANGMKWYKQHNIILSFAWFSAFAMIPIIYLIPDNYVAVHLVIDGLFLGIAIALFAYAFFLYKRNLILIDGYPQE
ncbi:MAG: hypothetical protein ABI456_15515 [Ktedonobacteraceae bacterium]